jgi:putative endonuclease
MLVNGFVYIVECADGKLYIGSHKGDDIAVRVAQHNSGDNPKAWTFKRRPVKLVWSAHFERVDEAFAFERQIKKWSRAKKDALINGDFQELKRLSVSRSAPADPLKGRKFPRDI